MKDKKLYNKLKTCPKCGSELQLDDLVFNFKGCQDEYYICSNENCKTGFFVKVRYEKAIKHKMIDEDGVIVEVRI